MQIGNIILPSGAGLAPMAGVTDAAMRLLCHEQGAAWSVSEMLSAKGWIYSQGKNQNAQELLVRLPNEGISALQLFGRDPDLVAEAAVRLQDVGFNFIDLNFGCPAPKIVNNGEGSALMREPKLIGQIVRLTVNAVSCPVTVKIRAGWDKNSINAVQVAQICEQAGASAIAVHGRTREQHYSGHADQGIIRAVKSAVSIPVIGNGDIRSANDAINMLNNTHCDGILIARAAQGNPWIFREIAHALAGKPISPITPQERISMALRHYDMEIQLHGTRGGMLEMRKHLAWYISSLHGAARFRERINSMVDIAQIKAALNAYSAELENMD